MKMEKFIQNNLLLGRLCEGAEKISGGQHPMFKGSVVTKDGETEAYIKNCSKFSVVFTEVIVALIGRMYDLPIPCPIIIKLDPDHPDIAVAKTTYLFASKAQIAPNFERFLRNFDEKEQIILEHKDINKIITFDELVANPDRTGGNILYDGTDIQLIDHEYCFHEKQNPMDSISDLCKTENLADVYRYHKGHNDVTVSKTMKNIRSYIKSQIDTTTNDSLDAISSINFLGIDYNKRVEFVRNFILTRLPVLGVLIEASISNNKEDDDLLSQGGGYV
ncbi:HipA family kinase [Acinetobacter boissieri]|uniref:HipA-like kinase domain-containing protein n=1 Tax=Acinetobacter boissieri TaxID=1219383 RepID=A0A1G6IQU0_9GAMM|nr:HipA family kinase [Acinetobacter boissieri]SDC08783.1 hypothetical protein SAMN05421733_1094 [Acinetobacter boissieri]